MGETKQKRRTVKELRAEYRKLQQNAYGWVAKAVWDEAVKKLATALAKGGKITPAIWVEAARKATVKCDRCNGSGVYQWGACVNGRMSHSGACFACGGKGHQDQADFARNRVYWNHVKVV
jgi:hypothetical protein